MAVLNRLNEQVQTVIDESMNLLRFFVAVPYSSTKIAGSEIFLPIDAIREWNTHNITPVLKHHGSIPWKDLQSLFSTWIPSEGLQSKYDVFISYRWGEFDSVSAKALYDSFTGYSVAPEDNREVVVFHDIRSIERGENFQDSF